MRGRRWAIACWLGLSLAGAGAAEPSPTEFFEARVRPVLAEKCFRCHGPTKQMSGLRLDSRAAVLAGGDNGPAVRPGDPDHSPLIQAVRRQGELKMPPKEPLDAPAVEVLAAWVKMGLPWPETASTAVAVDAAWKRHWAFQPIRDPLPPPVRQASWPQTSVDSFILTKLEAKGLTPSPPADRRTLLRRVTFDLIGLPPTPEEVEAFAADRSPDAFAKVVDRLLASPHYGERWGRYWLDVARFADTKGYVFFEDKDFPWAWTYRDYVIGAFNEDLPYDRFLLEQIAADRLIPGTNQKSLTALGFLTLGGRFMNNQHDILDDRIDVVTRGLMGLTVTCARCHDHKFDPIPTRDYYALYGVFASSVEPAVPPLFADPPATPEYEKFAKELAAREQKLDEFLRQKHAELIRGAKTRAAEYLLAAHALRDKPDTGDFMLIADGGDLNPTMVVRWKAYLARTRKTPHAVFTLWHALADLPEPEFAARAPAVLENLSITLNPLVRAAFTASPPSSLAEAARRYGDLLNHADMLPGPPSAAEEELQQVFRGPGAPPNLPREQINDLELLPDRPAQAKLQELRKAVEKWRIEGPGAPPRAMALVDAAMPFEPRVFLRGNPNNLGDPVPRQFLAVLSGPNRQPFRDGSGRLELARAVVDRNNPLTARVLVNRVWLHHFGTGIVRTPGDFGLRSDPPSHPELLDHLAARFMANGWSVKWLHREILLSATYQQQSDDRPDGRRTDPDNILLWRMNRRRLDFEALRDALLAVSGRLRRTVGGPSVRDLVAVDADRRTLYGYVDRLAVPGLHRTFDFPNPDATSPQRDATTIPQQALFLMNSPFVQDCARRLAGRPEVAAAPAVTGKLDQLYRFLFGRGPAADEMAAAQAYLAVAGNGPAAWERYAQALLLTNEFVFVD